MWRHEDTCTHGDRGAHGDTQAHGDTWTHRDRQQGPAKPQGHMDMWGQTEAAAPPIPSLSLSPSMCHPYPPIPVPTPRPSPCPCHPCPQAVPTHMTLPSPSPSPCHLLLSPRCHHPMSPMSPYPHIPLSPCPHCPIVPMSPLSPVPLTGAHAQGPRCAQLLLPPRLHPELEAAAGLQPRCLERESGAGQLLRDHGLRLVLGTRAALGQGKRGGRTGDALGMHWGQGTRGGCAGDGWGGAGDTTAVAHPGPHAGMKPMGCAGVRGHRTVPKQAAAGWLPRDTPGHIPQQTSGKQQHSSPGGQGTRCGAVLRQREAARPPPCSGDIGAP